MIEYLIPAGAGLGVGALGYWIGLIQGRSEGEARVAALKNALPNTLKNPEISRMVSLALAAITQSPEFLRIWEDLSHKPIIHEDGSSRRARNPELEELYSKRR